MTDLLRYDFGYEWPWTWGHLIAAVAFALMGAACVWRGWRLRAVTCAVLTAWALAGAFIVNVVLAFSIPAPLPTPRFLESGRGRVLDAGAGSGRSTLMVLQARPEAKVTALDIFDQRYGIGGNSPERLRANARAAGVESRLEVVTGDMRRMPFAAAVFDGAVSVAAIDHLSRADVAKTLGEMARVLRPGGDLLLVVINPDIWVRTAFPFLAHHGYFGGRAQPDRWRDALAGAHFEVVEVGTQPGSLYLLGRNAR